MQNAGDLDMSVISKNGSVFENNTKAAVVAGLHPGAVLDHDGRITACKPRTPGELRQGTETSIYELQRRSIPQPDIGL